MTIERPRCIVVKFVIVVRATSFIVMDDRSPFSELALESDHPGPVVDPELSQDKRIAIIRTSDRMSFRQCRRKWNWSSHMKGRYGKVEHPSPLWFGTGFHFALEDFHGNRHFPTAVAAFDAFVSATNQFATRSGPALPADVAELITLGHGMLDYYESHWLGHRQPLQTHIVAGKPQVEVHVIVPIDLDGLPPWVREHWDEVLYAATFDRVIVDEWGRLWIVEYKTAKRIEWFHLATDPQVTAYCWLGSQVYDQPIAGVIYQQHKKDLPEAPRILANGSVSTMTKGTTQAMYRKTLTQLYGPNSERWPGNNVQALNDLMLDENEDKDLFIQRDRATRSQHQVEAEGVKVLLELEDMLNPNLPLYPNPNRFFCTWCDFQHTCIDLDDGGDWEGDLNAEFKKQPMERDSWRQYLQLPTQQ